MHVVTLLTSPVTPNLEPALVESLRNAWGGGEARWLAPDEAAEFTVRRVPTNFEDVWGELQALGVDLAVQPAEGRRKKLLLADMDSTMIGQECIDELAELAGVGEKVREVTARAMNGELEFEDALRARVALLKDQPVDIIDKVLSERITLAPGGKALVATMKAAGGYTALVSGGFTAFTAHVAAELGFDEHRANRLLHEEGRLTGQVAEPILGRDAKVAALGEIARRLSISERDAIAVGDGANDLAMLRRAGTGVALHAKPVVAQRAGIRINFGDLTSLLYLQGYTRDEFQG